MKIIINEYFINCLALMNLLFFSLSFVLLSLKRWRSGFAGFFLKGIKILSKMILTNDLKIYALFKCLLSSLCPKPMILTSISNAKSYKITSLQLKYLLKIYFLNSAKLTFYFVLVNLWIKILFFIYFYLLCIFFESNLRGS